MIAPTAPALRSRGLPESRCKRCRYMAAARSLLVLLAVGAVIIPATVPAQAGAAAQQRGNAAQGADSGDQQFHIGTFRTKPSLKSDENPAGPVAPLDKPRGNTGSKSPSALTLLTNARKHLEANRITIAQRGFEAVIAQYPKSVEADVARGHLARLYAPGQGNEFPKAAVAQEKPVDAATRTAKAGRDVQGRTVPSELGAAPVLPINKALSRALGLAVGDRVFFAPGSDKLGSKARAVLLRQAHWLKRRSRLSVVVSGHADEPGGSSHNIELSKRRAQTVKDRLVEEGIAEDRVKIQALGRNKPIAQCNEPICAAQNRRAVTSIVRGSALRIRVKRTPAKGKRPEPLPWE